MRDAPPIRSFWLQQALAGEQAGVSPLAGDTRADVCIVGGGFTGLWTALELKRREPALDVLVIDRDICGGGASGRNGGFAMTWMSKADAVLARCGAQDGVRWLRESEQAVAAIGAFCAEHGIDAEFRHDGWLWGAGSDTQMGAWSATLDRLDRLGLHPFEELSRERARALGGSERLVGGVLERGVATVQPARLARGLRRVAAARGVRIHERTAMLDLLPAGAPRVRTDRGTVRAERVVLALNAWAHELAVFRRSILPVASDVIMTAPAPERLAGLGLTSGLAISDSKMLVNYYRNTPDGRICFGKGGGAIPFAGRLGARFDGDSPRRTEVHRELLGFYPELGPVPLAAAWRGPATRTADGLPRFGRLPGAPAVVYGHGYTGNGVAPSYLGGKILAAMALESGDEWGAGPMLEARPSRFLPPEPLRFLGAGVVRGAIRRKERAEDRGARATRLDRALAALAPKGLAPVKDPDRS